MVNVPGIWNLRVKLLLLLGVLMAGTLAVQSAVMEKGADHIFQEAENIAIELADEATEKLINAFYNSSSTRWSSRDETPTNLDDELSVCNSSQP
ncbi:MAG: hypothetical protein GWP41_09400 [Planctomycetia bacterium]|nr:hypothetical protein [Planctomycetia bacterium]